MSVKHLVRCPSIPGPDLRFPRKELAEREAANARRQGHEATVEEVLVR